jgi:hypothetical protein
MINHYAAQKALRVKLLTLSVATTGSIQISATTTGYERASGSFLTDGFVPGMEVSGSGFGVTANNTAKTIRSVTALTMTCPNTDTEAAGARTLTVGLPATRAWENINIEPARNSTWIEEEYVPGPMTKATVGPLGYVEALPLYVVKIYVPSGSGMGAARSYGDALLTLFAPGTSIATGITVRGDVAPFVGQLFQDVPPGFAVLPVTVPIRIRTANSI